MKILFVSPVPIDPPDAGNRARILTLIQGLRASGHEVHLAFIPMEQGDVAAMQRRLGAQRLHVLPWRRPWALAGLVPRVWRRLGARLNIERAHLWGIDDWYDDQTNAALQDLQRQHGFEVVFAEYVFASKALTVFQPPCVRVLDTHDCFAMRHRAYLQAGMAPQWFSTTHREEERAFARADVVLAIQAQEAAAFSRRLGADGVRVCTVGHLIDMPAPSAAADLQAAVFVGSANDINVAGAQYFIDQVLPRVQAQCPGFQLVLAGAVAGKLPDAAGVVKLGFVPSLRDAFAAGAMAINPVLLGTGVNIKLLDAMASGLPCVSTMAGARGLDSYGEGALLEVPDDDPQAFAQVILKLLDSGELRRHMGQRARAAAQRWNQDQIGALDALLAPRAATHVLA